MIRTSIMSVECDGCDFTATIRPAPSDFTDARKQVRLLGWAYENGLDFCPSCIRSFHDD